MTIVLGSTADGVLRIDLPVLIESRVLVQAQSGAGKSWALRRLLEQTHGRVQQIIIDPEGEFGSLREKFDYVLAGKGGDTPAEPRSAKLLARRLYELGVSAIVDISELQRHEQIRFVRVFLEALTAAPKTSRHEAMVVIDEAHLFCPEKGQAESAQAVIDLCTLGRKRGLCAILATQRLSKLHKDAAAELRNKLIGATGLDIDQVRAGDDLGFGKAERMALRDLKPGEFYAYGPALSSAVVRVTVGPVESRHPKVGERGIAAPPPPTDQIKKVLAKLADLPAEAEQEARTIEDFKRDNADLRRKLTLAEKSQRVETKPCDHEATIVRLEELIDEKERELARIEPALGELAMMRGAMAHIATTAQGTLDGQQVDVTRTAPPRPVSRQVPPQRREAPPPKSITSKSSTGQVSAAVSPPAELTKPQQRVVDAAGALHDFGIMEIASATLAAHAGYKYSGGFRNILSELRQAGLLQDLRPKVHRLTAAGEGLAYVDHINSATELRDRWLSLCTNSTRPVLQVLIDHYPEMIAGPELASLCEREYSGGFRNLMSELCTMSAATRPVKGHLRAADELFPEGLV